MARRNDGRVEPGQSLKTAFSARAWNRAQDAADVVLKTLGGVQGQEVPRQALPYTWILARNDTGEAVPVGGNMRLTTPVIEPTSVLTDNATVQFQRMPVFTGLKNTDSVYTDETTLAIAVEPIKPNGIGRVAISGVVAARFRVTSTFFNYALGFGSVEELQVAPFGPARILHVEGSLNSERQWGMVHLGMPGRTAVIEFTENWPRDTTKTCDVRDTDGLTLRVINVFAEVFNGCQELRYGLATLANDNWYLTAVEFGND